LNRQMNKRKVLIVTGSRGEYGYIRPIIRLMNKSTLLEPKVLVTNMHMLPEYGNSIKELEKDGIPVEHRIYMALAGYTNVTMAKSLGVFMLSFTDIINDRAPDMILLSGDRGEQLVAAIVGAHMNIPVAHIQAGELSGNVDGMSRHAITRFAHIHFAANEDAALRLTKMGEQPFRVFKVGAPQIDEFIQGKIEPKEIVAKKFSLNLKKPVILVVQHPVTEQAAFAEQQMTATMKAVLSLGYQAVVIYPNNDAGSVAIQKCIQQSRNINIRVERNVSREMYAGLMNVADVLIGNSSSGILEAPSFELPAVNIGRRQEGRFQGKNVINVREHDPVEIASAVNKALTQEFRDSLKNMDNPYGDGHSSERIVSILENLKIDEKLLFKQITY
jgi:GDP/UDP-N,N'-diacetylbacillosamine 2-epimerase (hydrolysing)